MAHDFIPQTKHTGYPYSQPANAHLSKSLDFAPKGDGPCFLQSFQAEERIAKTM
jgi:hypothetical protein